VAYIIAVPVCVYVYIYAFICVYIYIYINIYVNGVVVGPFEEEEEKTGIASDVNKVNGQEPATPSCL